MKWLRRLALAAGLALVLLIAGLLGLGALLLTSDRALEIALTEAGRISGGAFEAAEVDGNLLGPVQLEQVRIDTPTLQVAIDTLRLDWNLPALLGRRLEVAELSADGVSVRQLPGAPEEAPPPDDDVTLQMPGPFELPLDLALREVRISDLTYYAGPDAEPQVLHKLQIDLDTAGPRVLLDTLELVHPQGRLTGRGWLETQGDWPLMLVLKADARPPGYAPLRTALVVDGSLAALRVRQAAQAPYNVRLTARAESLFDTPVWTAALRLDDLQLARLSESLPAYGTTGTVEARGTGAAANVAAALAVVGPDAFESQLALQAEGDPDRVRIESLRVDGTPGTLTGEGVVALAGDTAELDVRLDWQNLGWPGVDWSSPTGQAALTGTPAAWQARLDARIDNPRQQAASGRVELAANGDLEQARLESLRAELLDGLIEGNGEIGWAEGMRWDVDLAARGIDPGVAVPDYPGAVDLSLASSGQSAPVLQAEARLTELGGRLRGQPLAGEASIRAVASEVTVEALDLRLGENRVQASGRVDTAAQTLDVQLELAARRLAQIAPPLAGSLTGPLSARGAFRQPRVEADLAGQGLQAGPARIDSLRLTGIFQPDVQQRSDLTLSAEGILVQAQSFDRLRLAIDGPLNAHRLSLDVQGEPLTASLDARGAADLETPGWRGELRELSLALPDQPTLALVAPARLAVSASRAEIDSLCLRQPTGARLCADGNWQAEGDWAAVLRLSDLDLAAYAALLPETLDLTGSVDLEAQLAGRGSRVTGEITGGSPRLRLAHRDETTIDPATELLIVDDLALDARLAPTGAQLRLAARLNETGRLDFGLRLPQFAGEFQNLGTTPLEAALQLQLDDLGWLPTLAPQLADVSGQIDLDMGLSGSLERPVLAGSAVLENAALEVPEIGLALSELELIARAAPDNRLTWTLTAVSGGVLRSDGSLSYVDGELAVEGTLRGNEFQAADLAEARVWLSPDMTFAYASEAVRVGGELTIPRAEIDPTAGRGDEQDEAEDGPQIVTPSADQVILTPEGEVPADTVAVPVDLALRLRVIMGEEVSFSGYGLNAQIGGSILLTDGPTDLPLASGELSVEGKYRAYGQRLTIERGNILFPGGEITEPGIDLRAVKSLPDVTVGVQATGPVQTPQLRLFSDPAMSQSDQLSYLLFGRPLNQSASGEGQALSRAATALGLAGGERLAQNLGGRVGLDDIRIDSDGAVDQSELIVGRYLSPRLYVSYGIGVFNAISTLRTRYELSRRWTLNTETGVESAADLLYTLER